MWFIGVEVACVAAGPRTRLDALYRRFRASAAQASVEVEQETSAPPPKKNPESAPVMLLKKRTFHFLSAMPPKDDGFSNGKIRGNGFFPQRSRQRC